MQSQHRARGLPEERGQPVLGGAPTQRGTLAPWHRGQASPGPACPLLPPLLSRDGREALAAPRDAGKGGLTPTLRAPQPLGILTLCLVPESPILLSHKPGERLLGPRAYLGSAEGPGSALSPNGARLKVWFPALSARGLCAVTTRWSGLLPSGGNLVLVRSHSHPLPQPLAATSPCSSPRTRLLSAAHGKELRRGDPCLLLSLGIGAPVPFHGRVIFHPPVAGHGSAPFRPLGVVPPGPLAVPVLGSEEHASVPMLSERGLPGWAQPCPHVA